MFHKRLRKMLGLNRDALSRVIASERLHWIVCGHFEVDGCGAMNEWLAAAPRRMARPARHVSLNDFADGPARMLANGEVLDRDGGEIAMDSVATLGGWPMRVLNPGS